MGNFFDQNFTVLSTKLLILHGTSMLLAILFFIFAKKILSLGRDDPPPAIQVLIVKLCLLTYFAFEFVDIVFLHAIPEYDRPLYKGALSILTIFVGIALCNLFNKWSKKRFGSERTIDGQVEIVATYYSRLTGLLFSIVMTIKVMYILVKIWELNSLLETTGFVGIIAAFLVFTNSIWLPDIYYGLVILNSDMFVDGDAVRFDNDGPIYVINRVSLIYTTLLNVENNNKAVLRNSKIIENKVENLTRRASIEGLRQSLSFKVSYPNITAPDAMVNGAELNLGSEVDRYYKKIENMFTSAHDYIKKNCNGSIANNTQFDWGITNAGDYALELVMHYYLAPLPSTKLTKKLRKILYETRQQIVSSVYTQSIINGIELSTPTLINIGNNRNMAQFRKALDLSRRAE